MLRLRFSNNGHVDDPEGHAAAHRRTFLDWICSDTCSDDTGCRAERLSVMIGNARNNREYDRGISEAKSTEKRKRSNPPPKSIRHHFPINPVQEQFGISSPSAEEQYVRQREAMEERKAHARDVRQLRDEKKKRIDRLHAETIAFLDCKYPGHSITAMPGSSPWDHAYEIAKFNLLTQYPGCIIDANLESALRTCATRMVDRARQQMKTVVAEEDGDFEKSMKRLLQMIKHRMEIKR